jgi:hypothetical protein
MRCCLLWLGILAILTASSVHTFAVDEKEDWRKAQRKKLVGRWTTVREEKSDQGKAWRNRVDLEFTDSELKVSIDDEKGGKIWAGPPLKVISVERAGKRGLAWRLDLERDEQIYFDFVGEKLIMVGKIGHRPFEGFPLSGEYRRADNPDAHAK